MEDEVHCTDLNNTIQDKFRKPVLMKSEMAFDTNHDECSESENTSHEEQAVDGNYLLPMEQVFIDTNIKEEVGSATLLSDEDSVSKIENEWENCNETEQPAVINWQEYVNCGASQSKLLSSESSSESDLETSPADAETSRLPMTADSADAQVASVVDFLHKTCGCRISEGKPCSSMFSVADLVEFRAQSRALDCWKGHINLLDILMLGHVASFCATGPLIHSTKKKLRMDRKRSRTRFMLKGFDVCSKMYYFAYNISQKKFKRVKKMYLNDGLVPQMHGNTLKNVDVEEVVLFIRNYLDEHGSQFSQSNYSIVSQPPIFKRKLYEKYREYCSMNQKLVLGYSAFVKIWKGKLAKGPEDC